MSLLEIRDLKKHFPVGDGFFSRNKGAVKAVDGVSLKLGEPTRAAAAAHALRDGLI